MSSARHDGSITEHPCSHVVDLQVVNLVRTGLEDLRQHAPSVARTAVRSCAPPVGRNDVFHSRAIACNPGLRQHLLQLD